MSDAADFAIAGQGAAPLTPPQIRTLAIEARRAWAAQRRLGMAGDSFDEFRRGAVADAAPGARGLRDLTQRDFAPVRAWLRELALQARPISGAAARETDDARRARFALRRRLERLRDNWPGPGTPEDYARSLFERIHGTTPEEASARQAWNVLFTLSARWNSRLRGEKAAERAGRGGRPENGQSAAAAAPRVFPRLSRAGIGHCGGEGAR